MSDQAAIASDEDIDCYINRIYHDAEILAQEIDDLVEDWSNEEYSDGYPSSLDSVSSIDSNQSLQSVRSVSSAPCRDSGVDPFDAEYETLGNNVLEDPIPGRHTTTDLLFPRGQQKVEVAKELGVQRLEEPLHYIQYPNVPDAVNDYDGDEEEDGDELNNKLQTKRKRKSRDDSNIHQQFGTSSEEEVFPIANKTKYHKRKRRRGNKRRVGSKKSEKMEAYKFLSHRQNLLQYQRR